MFVMFQAVFAWSEPVAWTAIEAGFQSARLADQSRDMPLPDNWLRSFLVDGMGWSARRQPSMVFLPQIVLLFLFILVLEESWATWRARRFCWTA
jgi:ferrous iron transport protein B